MSAPMTVGQLQGLPFDDLVKLHTDISKNKVMILVGYQKAANAYAQHLASSNDSHGLLIDAADFKKASKHLLKCIKGFEQELKQLNQFVELVAKCLKGGES